MLRESISLGNIKEMQQITANRAFLNMEYKNNYGIESN